MPMQNEATVFPLSIDLRLLSITPRLISSAMPSENSSVWTPRWRLSLRLEIMALGMLP